MRLLIGTAAALAVVGYLTISSVQISDIKLFTTQHDTMQTELEQAFISYIAKFGKSYSSKEEIPKRFAAFSNNYIMIKEHNSRPDATFLMEINAFADVLEEEYHKGLTIDESSFNFLHSENKLMLG
jgi:hypothetical protein